MTTSLKQLKDQALALSVEERANLAQFLMQSLHSRPGDAGKALADYMKRRCAAAKRGEDFAYVDQDVFAEVRRLSRGSA